MLRLYSYCDWIWFHIQSSHQKVGTSNGRYPQRPHSKAHRTGEIILEEEKGLTFYNLLQLVAQIACMLSQVS